MRKRETARRLTRWVERGCHGGEFIWRRHLLGQRFIEKRIYDYRLTLDGRDPGISRQLLLRGAREPEQKFILESHLGPGMTVLDLGANMGYYTVMMAKLVGAAGCVYAVEPAALNFALLERNIRLNRLDNVLIENVAIADRDGEKELLLTAQSNWHSFHRPQLDPATPWLDKYRRKLIGSTSAPTRSLNSFLSGKRLVDFLRMDLEGYEVAILQAVCGLPPAISTRLQVLFETHPEFYGAHNDMRSVLEALCRERGYRVKYLVSDYQHGSRRHAHIEPAEQIFARRGYGAEYILRQFHSRAIYADVRTADAIDLICESECVNAALLTCERRTADGGR